MAVASLSFKDPTLFESFQWCLESEEKNLKISVALIDIGFSLVVVTRSSIETRHLYDKSSEKGYLGYMFFI